jgi:hypothetical protein
MVWLCNMYCSLSECPCWDVVIPITVPIFYVLHYLFNKNPARTRFALLPLHVNGHCTLLFVFLTLLQCLLSCVGKLLQRPELGLFLCLLFPLPETYLLVFSQMTCLVPYVFLSIGLGCLLLGLDHRFYLCLFWQVGA